MMISLVTCMTCMSKDGFELLLPALCYVALHQDDLTGVGLESKLLVKGKVKVEGVFKRDIVFILRCTLYLKGYYLFYRPSFFKNLYERRGQPATLLSFHIWLVTISFLSNLTYRQAGVTVSQANQPVEQSSLKSVRPIQRLFVSPKILFLDSVG